nr:MAG TPA: hypothetical protein [Caudoviricetes sp.]
MGILGWNVGIYNFHISAVKKFPSFQWLYTFPLLITNFARR